MEITNIKGTLNCELLNISGQPVDTENFAKLNTENTFSEKITITKSGVGLLVARTGGMGGGGRQIIQIGDNTKVLNVGVYKEASGNFERYGYIKLDGKTAEINIYDSTVRIKGETTFNNTIIVPTITLNGNDLQTTLDDKANVEHTHTTNDVMNLQDYIDSRIEDKKNDFFKEMYPVGAIYVSMTPLSNISGATRTSELTSSTITYSWNGCIFEYISDRTFLYSAGTLETTTEGLTTYEEDTTAAATGGEAEHKLIPEEMPKHKHNIGGQCVNPDNGVSSQYGNYPVRLYNDKAFNWSTIDGLSCSNIGESKPHNNLPPYQTVFMYKRIQ